MRKVVIVVIVSLMIMGIVWWMEKNNTGAEIVFCDVGQGQAILFKQKNFEFLVDTGPNDGRVLDCLESKIPWWDKTIEVVVVSHWDSDHSGGLKSIIKYYKINSLYSYGAPKEKYEQKIYTDNLTKNDILKTNLIQFEVLSPDHDWGDENNNSIVGCFSYGDINILIMGDVTSEVEDRLVWRKDLGKCAKTKYLVVSHHGSAAATGEILLEAVKPEMAVISVGIKNKFGHPTKEVLERLASKGIKYWRTDRQGDLTFSFE